MSADHRKPVVAFVVLAFIAAAIVGVQRADAHNGRFFAAFVGGTGQSHGSLLVAEAPAAAGRGQKRALGAAFTALSAPDANIASPAAGPTAGNARERGAVRRNPHEVSRGGTVRRPDPGPHAGRGRSGREAGKPALPHGKAAAAVKSGERDLARSHRGLAGGSRRATDVGRGALGESVWDSRSEAHEWLERAPRGLGDGIRRLTETRVDGSLLGK